MVTEESILECITEMESVDQDPRRIIAKRFLDRLSHYNKELNYHNNIRLLNIKSFTYRYLHNKNRNRSKHAVRKIFNNEINVLTNDTVGTTEKYLKTLGTLGEVDRTLRSIKD